jgi:stearoyl-CoA desaturase (delta-9 desaturase)
MALQNSALIWSAGHRAHHRYIDDPERDPYCARRGFWFSHIGWMLHDYPSGQPDFGFVRELQNDRLVMWQHRHYLPVALAMNFGVPLLLGWASGDLLGTLLLAGVLRLVVSHHLTFCINSLAHMIGVQPYTDENTARDNAAVALLTFGEGYHNFHHMFAHDYRNGVRWWQWDPTKWLIASLQPLGLTRRLKRTPVFQIQRALLAMQFKRAQARLARLPVTGAAAHIESLRGRLAHEYDSFLAALAEWARVKEQWLGEKKRAVLEQWEQVQLQRCLREIEGRLSLQLRRVRLLQAQLT